MYLDFIAIIQYCYLLHKAKFSKWENNYISLILDSKIKYIQLCAFLWTICAVYEAICDSSGISYWHIFSAFLRLVLYSLLAIDFLVLDGYLACAAYLPLEYMECCILFGCWVLSLHFTAALQIALQGRDHGRYIWKKKRKK